MTEISKNKDPILKKIPIDPPKNKLLFIADANFLAHVSRTLEIAKVLHSFGYDIEFAGDGKFTDLPKKYGFKVHYVLTVDKETTLNLAKKALAVDMKWWKNIIFDSIDSDLAVIDKVKPSAVIGDMHWTLKAAAYKCQLPYISIVNTHWTKYYNAPIRALHDHITTRMLGKRLAEAVLPLLKAFSMSYFATPYRKWRKLNKFDDLRVNSLFDVMEGDLTILADIPEVFPVNGMSDTVQHVGPILWESTGEIPGWLDGLNPGLPTIYITMGSTGIINILKVSVETFADKPYNVIATIGELEFDKPFPANFYVTKYAPGLPILERSDITINHAGNGSILQALTAGVPIIAVPTHVDQEINAQRIDDLGLGIVIPEKELTPQRLEAGVRKVLNDDSYGKNVADIAQAISNYEGPVAAARLIHEFVQTGKVKSR